VTTESFQVEGRIKVSLWQKCNPLWWALNTTEQTVDDARWYLPERPYWWRWLCWNVFRNPFQNLSCFVIGVQDKNYTVTGREPASCVQRDDLRPPELGWQWCMLHGGDLWWPRPFVSYSGKRNRWYAGWQPSGFARVKVNGPIAITFLVLVLIALAAGIWQAFA
jgi:hypothetical protein